MNSYICKKCKFHETDQIGDIVCQNPESFLYGHFIEEELEQLNECKYFKEDK